MGIETSGVNRKGKEFGELGREKNPPILNPYPSPKGNTNTRGKKGRRGQIKEIAVTPVQKLYETCKKVFSDAAPGIVPPPDKIEKLRAVLDGIKPEDVGLSPGMMYFRSPPFGRTPVIRYLHLHECDKFSMGIFCFPPSGVIPLHNHPGMTVFSKLLFGKMHIKSYDWVVEKPDNDSAAIDPSHVKQPEGLQFETKLLDVQGPELKEPVVREPEVCEPEVREPEVCEPEVREPEVCEPEVLEPEVCEPEVLEPEVCEPEVQEAVVREPESKEPGVWEPEMQEPEPKQPQPQVRLAKVKIDSEFTAPCKPTILYPADGGNMHQFAAITACAVLDVLGPPYSDPDGRHCTYYYDYPFSTFSVDGVTVAEEEKESHAWLLEKGMQPEEFAILGELYRGPKVVKS